MARKLGAEEKALWAKVVATVNPLGNKPPQLPVSIAKTSSRVRPSAPPTPRAMAAPAQGTTLDGSWDRRLSRGQVHPDLTVDLHGRTLAAAYDLLDKKLEQAVLSGARILLLVTGKPPRGEGRPVQRGAIRAAVLDWLAASRHARHIAAVRGAHARHGGTGALYIVLRRSDAGHRQNS